MLRLNPNRRSGVLSLITPASELAANASATAAAASETAATTAAGEAATSAAEAAASAALVSFDAADTAQLFVGQSGAVDPVWVDISGDATLSATGTMTVAKSNGVAWPNLPATGGASQFLKQGSAGGAVTVIRPTTSDVSFTPNGSGAILLPVHDRLCREVWIDEFDADPTGADDSTPAILAAAAALPASGGYLRADVGTYKIGTKVSFGDGSSSAPSTRQGIVFKGSTLPCWNAYTPGTTLVWGGGSDAMFQMYGYMQGWGFQDLTFDGNDVARHCIAITSCGFGNSSNLVFKKFTIAAYYSTTYAAVVPGVPNVDSIHNFFKNITITMPDVNNVVGIYLDGGVGVADPPLYDTDANYFDNVTMYFPNTSNQKFGVYLKLCDGNHFRGLHLIGNSDPNEYGIGFDYTSGSGNWPFPNSNTFTDFDPNASGTSVVAVGSRLAGTPINFVQLAGGNGALILDVEGVAWASQCDYQKMPRIVSELPAAGGFLVGLKSFVTDSSVTTFNSVVADGGANKVPVYCDGTNWRVG